MSLINNVIKHPNKYKVSPVKRVWLSKNNNKLRPIGIPTIIDRVLQQLMNLVLEPLVEMTSDTHNYGFWQHWSFKNAIAYLKLFLKTKNKKTIIKNTSKINKANEMFELLPQNKIILDADIKGFFDNNNHNWVLDNLFLDNTLWIFIKAWLKSGVIDKNIYTETITGTPQGGIISPTLVNFTLNGLEQTVMNSLQQLTKSKEKWIAITLKDGSKTWIASYLAYVRYADDFVVLAWSKYLIKNYVLPAIKQFLKIRGLTINNKKTKIFKLSDKNKQLNFLGYTFKYNNKWSVKKRVFYNEKTGLGGIALYPNKLKVIKFINKIKFVVKKSNNFNAYNLIARLNPILRDWSNYYNLANSSFYRNTVRNAVYRLVWKWSHRKHKRWGRKLIAKTYFLTENPNYDKSKPNKAKRYQKIQNNKWIFHGTLKTKSRYSKKNKKTIYLINITYVSKLLAAKHYVLPKKLVNIHAFHPNYMQLLTFNTNLKFKAAANNWSFKQRLLKKQNNTCAHCKEPILITDNLYGGGIHIHHKKPIYKKGLSNDINNMVLLHSWCHYEIDHKK